MGSIRSALTNAAFRISTGDIEVAQDCKAYAMSGCHVAQHPFANQLGGPVGIDRMCGCLFGGPALWGLSVNSRRARENEVLHAMPNACLEQAHHADYVIVVVLDRLCYRLRRDHRRRKMQHAVEPM